MKTEHLQALVIDRHFGELPAEVTALLDAYLAAHPDAAKEADAVLTSLGVTGQALARHPELVRLTEPETAARGPVLAVPRQQHWARAAAVALLAGLAAMGGFYAGSSRNAVPGVAVSPSSEKPAAMERKASPWTRYRMTVDPQGNGMQIVRVDKPQRPLGSIQ